MSYIKSFNILFIICLLIIISAFLNCTRKPNLVNLEFSDIEISLFKPEYLSSFILEDPDDYIIYLSFFNHSRDRYESYSYIYDDLSCIVFVYSPIKSWDNIMNIDSLLIYVQNHYKNHVSDAELENKYKIILNNREFGCLHFRYYVLDINYKVNVISCYTYVGQNLLKIRFLVAQPEDTILLNDIPKIMESIKIVDKSQ